MFGPACCAAFSYHSLAKNILLLQTRWRRTSTVGVTVYIQPRLTLYMKQLIFHAAVPTHITLDAAAVSRGEAHLAFYN